jgi:hypothetical protein
MEVKIVKMFNHGVEVDRRMLSDRSTVQHRGKLVIADETDQGRHRPSKIARIVSARGTICELRDVSLVWANEGRITLTGDERLPNEQGNIVCYKQSWLCTLEAEPSLLPAPGQR